MTAIVTACSSFGLTVSGAKTEIMCLETKGGGKVSFTINAAGQVYKQAIEFVHLGGAITADRDLSIEITRRLQRAWACFQRYKMEINDRPGVRLRLKVRLLKAEVVETLPYGCMRWSPASLTMTGYDGFTTPCSFDALDGGNGSATTTPYRTPTRLPRQLPSIQATVRKRRILFAGFVARMGEERLPQRVILGSLLGVRATQGGKRRTGWLI